VGEKVARSGRSSGPIPEEDQASLEGLPVTSLDGRSQKLLALLPGWVLERRGDYDWMCAVKGGSAEPLYLSSNQAYESRLVSALTPEHNLLQWLGFCPYDPGNRYAGAREEKG
jgi:hypothetical protein